MHREIVNRLQKQPVVVPRLATAGLRSAENRQRDAPVILSHPRQHSRLPGCRLPIDSKKTRFGNTHSGYMGYNPSTGPKSRKVFTGLLQNLLEAVITISLRRWIRSAQLGYLDARLAHEHVAVTPATWRSPLNGHPLRAAVATADKRGNWPSRFAGGHSRL